MEDTNIPQTAGSRPPSRTGSQLRDAAATGALPPLSSKPSNSSTTAINNNNASNFGRSNSNPSPNNFAPNFEEESPPKITTIPQTASEQALSEMIAGNASVNRNNNNNNASQQGQQPSHALPPQLLPAFYDSAPADTVNSDKVLWFGTVDKVGKGLGAHRRAAFVTSSGIVLALPTGGVTRVIPLECLGGASIIPPNVIKFEEPGKHDLVLCCADPGQRDVLSGAVVAARRQKLGPAAAPLIVRNEDSLVLDANGVPTGSSNNRSPGRFSWQDQPQQQQQSASNFGVPPSSVGIGLPIDQNYYGQNLGSNNNNNNNVVLPKQYPELTSNLANLISNIGGYGNNNDNTAPPAFQIPNYYDNNPYTSSSSNNNNNNQRQPSASNSPPRNYTQQPPATVPGANPAANLGGNIPYSSNNNNNNNKNNNLLVPPSSALSASSLFPAAYYNNNNNNNNNNQNPPQNNNIPQGNYANNNGYGGELSHLYPPSLVPINQSQQQQQQLQDKHVPLPTNISGPGAFSNAIDQVNQGYGNALPLAPSSLEIARSANQVTAAVAAAAAPHNNITLQNTNHHQHHQHHQQQDGEDDKSPSFSPASPVPGTSRNLLEATVHAVALTEHARQAERLQSLEDQIQNQNRLLESMRQQSEHKQLTGLRDELGHARNLIADLQVALKSQESTFAEMLKSQELLKTSDEARAHQDRELQFLRHDRDALQRQLREKENALMDMREAMSRVEAKGHSELERLRQAFVDYDKSVGEYVEKQRLQHLEELEALRKRLIAEQELNYQNQKQQQQQNQNNNNNNNNNNNTDPGVMTERRKQHLLQQAATRPQTPAAAVNQNNNNNNSTVAAAGNNNNNADNNNNNNSSAVAALPPNIATKNQALDAHDLRNALLDLAGGNVNRGGRNSLENLQDQVNNRTPSYFHPSSPTPNGVIIDNNSTSNDSMFAPHHHHNHNKNNNTNSNDDWMSVLNRPQQQHPQFTGTAAALAPSYPSHVLEAARQQLMAFDHTGNNNGNPLPLGGPGLSRRDRSIL